MGVRLTYNRPKHGMGPKGRAKERAPVKAGAHMPMRHNSGFDDARGYESGPKVNLGQRQAGRAPTMAIDREAGHYHPLDTRVSKGGTRGLMGDVADVHAINSKLSPAAFTRRDGRHTGKGAQGDQGLIKGGKEKGNSFGTAPTARSSKPGVRGSPDSHLGTAGRGAPGKHGRGDAWKGAPKRLSEDISHSDFESLGAD